MRIRVFTREQNVETDQPAHIASAGLGRYVLGSFGRALKADVKGRVTDIQLMTNECWFAIKERYATISRKYETVIPVIKAPRLPETLLLQYPITNQESNGKRKSRELWLGAKSFGTAKPLTESAIISV